MARQAAIHHRLLHQEHSHGEVQDSGVLEVVLAAPEEVTDTEEDEDGITIDVIAIPRTRDPDLEQHLQAVQNVRQKKDHPESNAERSDDKNDESVMAAEVALADAEEDTEDGDIMDAEDHLLSVVQEEWVGLT